MKVNGQRNRVEKLSRDVEETLAINSINLGDLLSDSLENVLASLDLIGFIKNEHKNKVEKSVLPLLLKKVNDVFRKYTLLVTSKGISIIILDLLKNAVRFTDNETPELDITFTEFDEDNYTLHFINNQQMSKEAYEFIQNDVDAIKWSKSSKVGIRTIKKILAYKELGNSGMRWRLRVDTRSIIENRTDIFIIIPKTDIILNT